MRARQIRHSAAAASTVPAHVLKFFAVNGCPVISLRYALTSVESTQRALPFRRQVLKQRAARYPPALRHDARQRRVVHFDVLHDPALGAEGEAHRPAVIRTC
jgi:hypothetical protein